MQGQLQRWTEHLCSKSINEYGEIFTLLHKKVRVGLEKKSENHKRVYSFIWNLRIAIQNKYVFSW